MTESALSTFLAAVRPDAAATVIAVDQAVQRVAQLDTAIKWGKLTYAANGDFHHWICATSVSKRLVSLTFHFGGLLPDPPAAFREGSSTFLRMLDFTTPDSVDTEVLARTVSAALAGLDYFTANWKAISAGERPPR